MLNPLELNQIASLSAEKERISTNITQRIENKEDQLGILSMANQMEDDLCVILMSYARKGKMFFPVSSLANSENFCSLPQNTVKDILSLIDSLVRKAKNDSNKRMEIEDFPHLCDQIFSEARYSGSISIYNNIKVPVYALFEVLVRFKKAGFMIQPTFEFTTQSDIYIRWDNIDFNLHNKTPDFKTAASAKIAQLKMEVKGLRGIEELQSNYEKLLEENKRLHITIDSLLSLKNQKGAASANEGKPSEVP